MNIPKTEYLLIADTFRKTFIHKLQLEKIPILDASGASVTEVQLLLRNAKVLLFKSKLKITSDVLQNATLLKAVIRAGTGIDHIDSQALAERGVALHATAGANAEAVGEQTIGMLLALTKNILKADRQVKQNIWQREENRGVELSSLKIGIIGYGATGSAFGRRLAGFGTQVLAYDKYKTGFGSLYVQECTMQRLFQEADVVSLHIPLTQETHQMVNEEWIASFDKPIRFLNLSRGEIVLTNSLIHALRSGKILAAGLDVLENENLTKLTDKQKIELAVLQSMDNVILTPHIGGWTFESEARIEEMALQAILPYFKE